MGIYVDITLRNVRIPTEHENDVLKAINRLTDPEIRKRIQEYTDNGVFSDQCLPWVAYSKDGFKTIQEAMKGWQYKVGVIHDCIEITKTIGMRKFGDDYILFAAIAPFVATGGEITIEVEECEEKFVYTFAKGQVTETLFHWEPGEEERVKSRNLLTFLED